MVDVRPVCAVEAPAYTTFAMSFLVGASLVVNAAGLIAGGGAFLFLLGLINLVGLSLLNFWLLLMGSVLVRTSGAPD
ncbi:MAG: hypothetical protein MJE66_01985 [Proteobacteria bacterium]|nr:hypothetical protein [Pseudomonadota bacterium]